MNTDEFARVLHEIGDRLPPSELTAGSIEEARRRRAQAELADRRRRHRRRGAATALAVAATIAAVVGVVLTGTDDHDVRTEEPPRASTTRPARTSAVPPTLPGTSAPATTVPPAPTTVFPVEGRVLTEVVDLDGGTVSLAVADATTGAVDRVVWEGAVAPVGTEVESALLDADLGPDGTAYVVERTGPLDEAGMRPGGTRLIAVGTQRELQPVPNVTSVRVSADGRRAAVSVLSPDGDGDGAGTAAIRIVDLATGEVSTLASTPLPLGDTGAYVSEFYDPFVVSWLPGGEGVVYREFCCDSGSVIVAPADGSGSVDTWPRVDGYASTDVVGFDPDGDPLVQRRPEDADEEWRFEIVALDRRSGAISGPLASGSDENTSGNRYDLVGTEVPGTPIDRAGDSLSSLIGTSTDRGRVTRVFG